MKALVTGATGLIGNAIARALHARGDDVVALVRDVGRARGMVPDEVVCAPGDITVPATLPAAMSGVDVVFHAAGLPEQWARDRSIFDRVNRDGTVNVVAAARDAGIRRVIYTSTMDVFTPGADGLLRETSMDPSLKHSAYERSKQLAEREVDRLREGGGIEVVLLNPCSVYGPSPVETGMTEFFRRLLDGKAPMVPPGGVSLAYVEQVAAAHLAAVERGVDGERYLLADGSLTMRELAEQIVRAAGLPKVPRVAPAALLRLTAVTSAPIGRIFGVKPPITRDALDFLLWDAKVDAAKARAALGYEPMSIEEGVRRTVAHLRARPYLC